ncbi:MAG: ATPase domain-containing protein [Anaerolineae bacterium]|jgi:circadian clock protein KaiC
MADERVLTGSEGLDAMLGGGFLPGSMVLVRGAPGTGKTSLALQFLIRGAREHQAGMFISFEEFPTSLYRDARSLGWDLKDAEERGLLHLRFTSPEVFLADLEPPESPLNTLIREANVSRLVVDSVSHFDRLTDDPQELRGLYSRAVNGLRREQVTAMLLGEESRSSYGQAFQGGLSFLVDAILLMRYVEIESAMQRAILVLKIRGSAHAKEIRRYVVESGGLRILDVFEGREGLLSGTPHEALR